MILSSPDGFLRLPRVELHVFGGAAGNFKISGCILASYCRVRIQ